MARLLIALLLAGCGGTSFPWDSVACTATECRAFWVDEQGDPRKVLMCSAELCECHREMHLQACPAPEHVTQDGLHEAWKQGCCQR